MSQQAAAQDYGFDSAQVGFCVALEGAIELQSRERLMTSRPHAPVRDFQRPGRSQVLGTRAMVSTPHHQATAAALDMLRAGGNAVDAAIAAVAMLGVVDPTQTGIGGDCFALYAPNRGGHVVAINGSGWAPARLSTNWLLDAGLTAIPPDSPHAVTIPGSVSAWALLEADHGRLGLASALQPAIHAAEDGFPITERVARDWLRKEEKLSRNADAARIFLRDGAAPRFGTVFHLPEMAASLRAIAHQGPTAFYRDWIAEDILSTLQALGGLHEADDFALFVAEYVAPIRTSYRGYDVWQCPPNGVGTVVLMMLRALENSDLSGMGARDAGRIHLLGEIGRLAYASRSAVLGDPRTGVVPLDWLLSEACAATLRESFSPTQRNGKISLPTMPNHRETVAVCVVDEDRNAISLINSNFDDFGSGIVAARSGIVLQNRGCGFVLQPGHPNTAEGRKRPVHTIIPGILTKSGRTVMPFAVTGGQYQPLGQVALLTHVIDDGMALQQAIDEPRAFSQENMIELESGFGLDVSRSLSALGYSPVLATEPIGTAQAVWIDHAQGVLHGGADGRRDGLALGL